MKSRGGASFNLMRSRRDREASRARPGSGEHGFYGGDVALETLHKDFMRPPDPLLPVEEEFTLPVTAMSTRGR